MTNLLITGSGGFIGKNLINHLCKDKNILIVEFKRGDDYNRLKDIALKADFIIHLAGEVRPSSSDDSFKASNLELTERLVAILDSNRKGIPILFTSTVHAIDATNAYGNTKRLAEKLIEDYSIKYKVSCWIYRLPHIFGEGCKPNYNSVISTWIYNSIVNLEITVFNREAKINYCYVQDLIKNFYINIVSQKNDENIYCYPPKIYQTTLGEVVDSINRFKNNTVDYDKDHNFDFKSKLKNTYKWYYKKYAKSVQ